MIRGISNRTIHIYACTRCILVFLNMNMWVMYECLNDYKRKFMYTHIKKSMRA